MPLALVPVALQRGALHLTGHRLALAVVSGALTSGLGYALWYRILPRLGSFRASVAQLAVPAIAALAAPLMLAAALSVRLLVAELLVLGGVALALTATRR